MALRNRGMEMQYDVPALGGVAPVVFVFECVNKESEATRKQSNKSRGRRWNNNVPSFPQPERAIAHRDLPNWARSQSGPREPRCPRYRARWLLLLLLFCIF